MEPTTDPNIFIEERRPGYARFRAYDGRRWELYGCDYSGDCVIGMHVNNEHPGETEHVHDRAHLQALQQRTGSQQLVPPDCPAIKPGFQCSCMPCFMELPKVRFLKTKRFFLRGAMGSLPYWFMVWGSCYSVYWAFDHTFSLGVHIEPRYRRRGPKPGEPKSFGPYVDIHLPMLCISFGNNPVYAGALDAQRQFARGGFQSE